MHYVELRLCIIQLTPPTPRIPFYVCSSECHRYVASRVSDSGLWRCTPVVMSSENYPVCFWWEKRGKCVWFEKFTDCKHLLMNVLSFWCIDFGWWFRPSATDDILSEVYVLFQWLELMGAVKDSWISYMLSRNKEVLYPDSSVLSYW